MGSRSTYLDSVLYLVPHKMNRDTYPQRVADSVFLEPVVVRMMFSGQNDLLLIQMITDWLGLVTCQYRD